MLNCEEAIKILEIRNDFTEENLKKQYRILAGKYHTDNQETGNKEKFIKVKEAYNYLLNNLQEYKGYGKVSAGSNSEKCPRCNGTGKRREQVRTSRGMMARKVQCQYCNGTGLKE